MSLINDALKRTKQSRQQTGDKPSIPGSAGGAPLQTVDENRSGWKSVVWVPVLVVLLIAGIWFIRRGARTNSLGSAKSDSVETGTVQSARPSPPPPANPLERATATAQKWADRQSDQTPVHSPTPQTTLGSPPSPDARLDTSSATHTSSIAETSPKISPTNAVPPAAIVEPASAVTPPAVTAAQTAPAVIPAAAPPPEAKVGDSSATSIAAAAQALATAPPAPAPEMKLQGIFFRLKRPSALINGKTVTLGDEVDGARVITIDRQSVKLMISGKITVLTLR